MWTLVASSATLEQDSPTHSFLPTHFGSPGHRRKHVRPLLPAELERTLGDIRARVHYLRNPEVTVPFEAPAKLTDRCSNPPNSNARESLAALDTALNPGRPGIALLLGSIDLSPLTRLVPYADPLVSGQLLPRQGHGLFLAIFLASARVQISSELVAVLVLMVKAKMLDNPLWNSHGCRSI